MEDFYREKGTINKRKERVIWGPVHPFFESRVLIVLIASAFSGEKERAQVTGYLPGA